MNGIVEYLNNGRKIGVWGDRNDAIMREYIFVGAILCDRPGGGLRGNGDSI
jgi:hypothetical protein